jgi:DNA-directed RNA polymerase subunit RPC12/RpoP
MNENFIEIAKGIIASPMSAPHMKAYAEAYLEKYDKPKCEKVLQFNEETRELYCEECGHRSVLPEYKRR